MKKQTKKAKQEKKQVERSAKQLWAMRHSAEHVLTQAMLSLFPGIKMAMGPAIENGFYFDFDPGKHKISKDDFAKIEEEMKKIIRQNLPFRKKELSIAEARKLFKGNEYKQEWIDEIKNKKQKVTVYWTGNQFVDLCAGPHVKSTAEIGPFKLLSIAGAYWRGNEKNKMLTRIYGTAFKTQQELDAFLAKQEEAEKRDHRKIGKEQELFLISQEVGSGLPLYLPKGLLLRRILEQWITKEKEKRGYKFVWTPHIAKSDLYKKSKHWQKYEAMFNPTKIDEEEYVIKPMNCPHHFQIYLEKPRSYKELPLRIAENATVYRYEKAGELNGLLRVRSLTQDDTHTFIREKQIPEEIERILELATFIFETFNFSGIRARISTRDKKHPEKYLGSSASWNKAEAALVAAVKKRGLNFFIGEGEAAFYGPKIDIMVNDALGREWQLTTVQLDFNQPINFDMKYINEKGKEERPAILHLAIFGSFERFIAILIEHYAGAFPLWLSPIQIVVMPLGKKHQSAAKKLLTQLKEQDIRAELWEEDSIPKRIRNAELQKVPYVAVIGDKERKTNSVALRQRGKKDLGTIKIPLLFKRLKDEIEKKR